MLHRLAKISQCNIFSGICNIFCNGHNPLIMNHLLSGIALGTFNIPQKPDMF